MPTYEYECKKCSYNFELFQSMSDEPIKICPQCGKEVRRLIFGGAGVIFKGPGFYVTDKAAGAASKKSAAKGDKGSAGDQDSKGDTGSKNEAASSASTTDSTIKESGQKKTKPAAKSA